MSTAASKIGREVDAAAEVMMREHREWYEQAIQEIDRRLSDLEAREKKLAKNEAWVAEKRTKIERAIAGG
jgi:hypothetical protein